MTTTALTIEPVSGVLGAEISGVDLASDLSDETIAAIRAALVEHQVIFFRDQDLDAEAQMAFGRRFGELDTHPFVEGNALHEEVLDVITEPDDTSNFGGGWHIDVTFLPEPDMASILYAIEVPAAGGDTMFASQPAAYEALSETMRGMIDDLVAVHSAGPQYSAGGYSTKSKAMKTRSADRAGETVEHPLVRTHPESGRRGLYANPAFTTGIVGMRHMESRALLSFLYEHATHERFTCRFRWQPGSLAMWDNRSVMHHALFDYVGQKRVMRRITVKGDRPF